MTPTSTVHTALQAFAAAVTDKLTQITHGEPEEQLRAPFENFMGAAAGALGWNVVCTGETPLPDRLGRPDYAVHLNSLLAGYVELKPAGAGAAASRFAGRNLQQFNRFSAIPNLLYTDGNEWALYRNGALVDRVVRLSGDVASEGAKAVGPQDAHALKRPDSPLVQLAQDWRQLLFPDASDEQFSDAYAQTVLFALLLGRSEGADPLTLGSAEKALSAQHNLLSRALQVLTDPNARADIAAPLDLLLRVVAVAPPAALTSPDDPWLYFYEDFLAVYDPRLRKDAGAYYTPVEVVRAQVRLIDNLLVERLAKPLGFADPDVVTLDPALGTGTYLLGVIEHALGRVEDEQGMGAVPNQATTLAENLYGFELMAGPYAVSELRISRALRDRGGQLPAAGTHVFLTDTLESPNAKPLQPPLFLQPIADQHARALEVKSNVPVIVCLGNPPYDRHEAATDANRARTGGWVRHGDRGEPAVLRDFLDPAVSAGHGGHLKNLYNLYVYFWRWALWKVFEQGNGGPGAVSYISASSYLDGDAFCGMRERMRRQCDEIWILDLGGEGRGTRQSENVFNILTPVAIAVAFRASEADTDVPAKVHYARLQGTRRQKLAALDRITGFAKVEWRECPEEWQAPFRPAGEGGYFGWPLLTDLMPWQHSGAQFKRTWPIAPDRETLTRRWRGLLQAEDRSQAFRETRDRKIGSNPPSLSEIGKSETALVQLPGHTPTPRVERYAYRSFDRHWIIADARLGDFLRPDLWRAHSDRQVYLASSFTQPLGNGPALTSSASIPDLHYFSGRGAKDVLPLYRTADTSQANILPGLLDLLGSVYQRPVAPEDFLAYVYGVLAQPAFTARFGNELETRQLRLPITRDAALFARLRAAGANLLWLHTYGERFVPEGRPRGQVLPGAARCSVAVPGEAGGYPETFAYNDETATLHVGAGQFTPVAPDLYAFEVSGLKVLQSWLKYRMKKGAGRKSSPLDDIRPTRWTSRFTTELLELLWLLEATLAAYPEQAQLLEEVIAGDCIHANELPPAPDEMRKPPRMAKRGLFG